MHSPLQVLYLNTRRPRLLLEDYISLEWTRRFWQPSSFRLQIDYELGRRAKLRIGEWVQVGDHGETFKVEGMIREDTEESRMVTYSGRDIGGYAEERLIVPPALQKFDAQTDVAGETAMIHYARRHMGDLAAEARRVPGLQFEVDAARGRRGTWQLRWVTLAQALHIIGGTRGLGWDTVYNPEPDRFTFTILVGSNVAGNVVFSRDMDTVLSQIETGSVVGSKTLAVIGGAGADVGVDSPQRAYVTRSLGGGVEPSGFDRREVFVDGRHIESAAALAEQADAALSETESEYSSEVVVNPAGYRKDWNLGDLATYREADWAVDRRVRIVEVTTSMSAQEEALSVTLDNPKLTRKQIREITGSSLS